MGFLEDNEKKGFFRNFNNSDDNKINQVKLDDQ